MSTSPFPPEFWWGTATAAHQIEGSNVASDWWAKETAAGSTLEPSGDACDSYQRYREDMQIVASLGLTMYRFSIEWARIEPADGMISRAQIAHYARMVRAARELGLEPMVTLHHFTNPQWFAAAGGWREPDAVPRFTRYVEAILPVLDGVTWICTINEPNIAAMMAAREQDGDSLVAAGLAAPDPVVADALLAAHHAASKVLLRDDPTRRIGWSVATQDVQAEPGSEARAEEYSSPRDAWYLEQADGDHWVGVQAYTRTIVGPEGPRPPAPGVETTLTGWEYYPAAAAHGVAQARACCPRTPAFVTENGIATADDSRRIDYLEESLRTLAGEMERGSQVLGYLHWSLLDNYEWGSFAPTFGLVHVDPQTFVRTPKPSAYRFGEIARTRGDALQ